MPSILIEGLEKQFNGHPVFSDLSVTIPDGKITALVGPNGCGKSTLLKIISGIEKKNGGTIRIDQFDPFRFSYIFQGSSDSLLPWRTNEQNLAFPLELQSYSQEEIRKQIREVQKIIDLPIDWDGYPYKLSGGQKQILAFMRALIVRPNLLFLDEPFSALDYEWTLRLRNHLQAYCTDHKPTTLLITHSIEEAVYLADQIVVLSKKPTSVADVIKNPLKRPRSIQDIGYPIFTTVQRKVLASFKNVTQHEETHCYWPSTPSDHLDNHIRA
jgi:NitT/TauT family transport system ATP-binding protein